MLYELRIYDIAPNKMQSIIDRFTNVSVRLMKKYGVKPILFMEPVLGTNLQIIYLLEWNSLAEREERWDAFSRDPEWLSARAASEVDGPLAIKVHNSILKDIPSIMAQLKAD